MVRYFTAFLLGAALIGCSGREIGLAVPAADAGAEVGASGGAGPDAASDLVTAPDGAADGPTDTAAPADAGPDAQAEADATVDAAGATDSADSAAAEATVAADSALVPDTGASGDVGPAPLTEGGESPNFAINATHDNAQPDSRVASPLSKAWSKTFMGEASYPLVAMKRVFVAAAGAQPTVQAFDLASGGAAWGPLAVGEAVTLAYDQGRVYTLTRDGKLGALAGADGKPLWNTQLQGQFDFWGPPVATDGWVYVNGLESGGTTYAVIGSTGQTRWTAGTFDGTEGAVAVADGVVYEAEACGQLSAFEAPTLVLLWFAHGSCTGGGGSTPSVYGGRIWERDWASGNVIIDNQGKSHGSFAADTAPSFHAGRVFYMSKHTLTAVDVETNQVKWSFTGDGQLCSSAAIAGRGGQVFVGSASGLVYELDEATGAVRSMDDAGAPVSCGAEGASMAIGGNHLVVSAGSKLVVY